MAIIKVENTDITILKQNDEDYISLTDMANAKNGESRAADIIKNWIRTRFTLEFIGTWEKINNPNFKVVEFDHFKMQAGLPSFVLSVSDWVEKTNALGLTVKKGKSKNVMSILQKRGLSSRRFPLWARRNPDSPPPRMHNLQSPVHNL